MSLGVPYPLPHTCNYPVSLGHLFSKKWLLWDESPSHAKLMSDWIFLKLFQNVLPEILLHLHPSPGPTCSTLNLLFPWSTYPLSSTCFPTVISLSIFMHTHACTHAHLTCTHICTHSLVAYKIAPTIPFLWRQVQSIQLFNYFRSKHFVWCNFNITLISFVFTFF